MKKTKIILVLAFLTITYVSFTEFSVDVKGATYSCPAGKEFTYAMSSVSGTNTSVKVASTEGGLATGSITVATATECQTQENVDVSSYMYTREYIDGTLAGVSTYQSVTYGGETVNAYIATGLPGASYLAVDNETGIILNITSTTAGSFYLISWTFQTCPGIIPGYEILIMLSLSGVSIIGIIYYIRKKSR